MGGERDGAEVRALASHECGPGSIPIHVLSFLLVLELAQKGFSADSDYALSSKTNISRMCPQLALRAKVFI